MKYVSSRTGLRIFTFDPYQICVRLVASDTRQRPDAVFSPGSGLSPVSMKPIVGFIFS